MGLPSVVWTWPVQWRWRRLWVWPPELPYWQFAAGWDRQCRGQSDRLLSSHGVLPPTQWPASGLCLKAVRPSALSLQYRTCALHDTDCSRLAKGRLDPHYTNWRASGRARICLPTGQTASCSWFLKTKQRNMENVCVGQLRLSLRSALGGGGWLTSSGLSPLKKTDSLPDALCLALQYPSSIATVSLPHMCSVFFVFFYSTVLLHPPLPSSDQPCNTFLTSELTLHHFCHFPRQLWVEHGSR